VKTEIPHSPEAEQGALGCILTADGTGQALLERLGERHFFDIRNLAVFRGLLANQEDGHPLDTIALVHGLKDRGELESAGGFEYVSALPDATPSKANFDYYFDYLEERAARREALTEADTLRKRAWICRSRFFPSLEPFPEMEDAADFMAAALPEQEELIRGILSRGSKLALGGGSKAYKTWTLLDLALSVSHGQPWLCFGTTPGRVALCNFEIQQRPLQDRLGAVAAAKCLAIKAGTAHALESARQGDQLPKLCCPKSARESKKTSP